MLQDAIVENLDTIITVIGTLFGAFLGSWITLRFQKRGKLLVQTISFSERFYESDGQGGELLITKGDSERVRKIEIRIELMIINGAGETKGLYQPRLSFWKKSDPFWIGEEASDKSISVTPYSVKNWKLRIIIDRDKFDYPNFVGMDELMAGLAKCRHHYIIIKVVNGKNIILKIDKPFSLNGFTYTA
jgi:hypothetical protein